MYIEELLLQQLLNAAVKVCTQQVLIKLGSLKQYLSENEAGKIYGHSIVNRWIKEGLIQPKKDGTKTSKKRLDRIELEILAQSSNRGTFMTVEERRAFLNDHKEFFPELL